MACPFSGRASRTRLPGPRRLLTGINCNSEMLQLIEDHPARAIATSVGPAAEPQAGSTPVRLSSAATALSFQRPPRLSRSRRRHQGLEIVWFVMAWAVACAYPGFQQSAPRSLRLKAKGPRPINTSLNVLSPHSIVPRPSRVCSQRWRLIRTAQPQPQPRPLSARLDAARRLEVGVVA